VLADFTPEDLKGGLLNETVLMPSALPPGPGAHHGTTGFSSLGRKLKKRPRSA